MTYEKTTVDALPPRKYGIGNGGGLTGAVRDLAIGEALWVPIPDGRPARNHQTIVSASSRNRHNAGKKFITRLDRENNRVGIGRIS
jgi:hypothetical protein